jgi:Zn-dependent protease with chaperone function
MPRKSNLERIMSTAATDPVLQNIIDDYLRRDNYYQHAVLGYSFRQENSAFAIGGKIPKIALFNNPEIPIRLIYVHENYIRSLSIGELEFIVLHEMGHLVHNHVVWNIGLFLAKETIIDWLREFLGTTKKNARDLIGLVKLVLGRKTIEEEITAQKEFIADAYAVRLQGNTYHAMSVLHNLSEGNLDSPSHVTQDGVFFKTAVTFKERIEAIQRL